MVKWKCRLGFFFTLDFLFLIISINIVLIKLFNSFLWFCNDLFNLFEETVNNCLGLFKSFLSLSLCFHFHQLSADFFEIRQVLEQIIAFNAVSGVLNQQPKIFQWILKPNIRDLILKHLLVLGNLKLFRRVFNQENAVEF